MSRNFLLCVIDRTMRDGQYKCHLVSINLGDILLTLIAHGVFYMKKHIYTLNMTCF